MILKDIVTKIVNLIDSFLTKIENIMIGLNEAVL